MTVFTGFFCGLESLLGKVGKRMKMDETDSKLEEARENCRKKNQCNLNKNSMKLHIEIDT